MADIETLHQRANDALMDGQNERAIEIYNEILKEAPGDEIALSQLMDLYYETNRKLYYLTRANLNIFHQKYEHAINDCKKALNADPASVSANLKLARLYRVAGKNLKAIDTFSRVLELDSKNFEAYRELCDLYLIENSPQSAVQNLQRAVEVFEEDSTKAREKEFLQNLLAKIYFDLGDYDKALESVKDEMLKAKILLQNEQSIEAKKILDRLQSKKMEKEQLSNYFSLLAQYNYNEKKFEEALDAVKHYVELNSPDPVSFQMKALIYEQMGKEFESAFNWGCCNKVQGKFEEAIIEFLNAYQQNPNDKNNLIELANLYNKTGETFTSIEFWNKVYDIDEDETAKKILGDFYYEHGDYKMAEKYGRTRPIKESGGKNSENVPAEEDEGLLNKILKFFEK